MIVCSTVDVTGEVGSAWDVGGLHFSAGREGWYANCQGIALGSTSSSMSIIEAFVTAVAQAVATENGEQIALLLQIPQDFSEPNYRELLPALDLAEEHPITSQMAKRFGSSSAAELWVEALMLFFKCLKLARRSRFSITVPSARTVFTAWLTLCSAYLRLMQTGQRWHLPALYGFCEELWAAARICSEEEGGSEAACEEAARLVNKAFTACLTDRSSELPYSRKWGAYRISALLFRIYFSLGQLSLCANAVRAMGSAQLPPLDAYPAAARVTFRYYLGRFHFVNERYAEAEKELMSAFKECHRDALTAKRQILYYLLPLRLLVHGAMPAGNLLSRYQLDTGFYAAALYAIRSGNVAAYRSLLDANEHGLLGLGTFPIWERLQLVAYRSLVRRVHQIQGESSRLSLQSIQLGMHGGSDGIGMDLDEVGCLLAVLIDAGLLKGYIAQQHAILVLSQKDPFPPISACRI